MQLLTLSAHNPGPFTGAGNNTYLLIGSTAGGSDRCAVLIDAGEGRETQLQDLQRALATAHASLTLVLVTHAHVDHISGAAAIRQRWPDVRFAKMPWPGRDERYAADITAIQDNECVVSDGVTLRAIHTPGHAPDHLCFADEETGWVFCGDLLQKNGTVVIPATAGGSLTRYLESLQRIAALRPSRLYPAHGPVIEDPLPMIDRTMAHRRQRERQVLAAVTAGSHTVEEVVAAIYANLDPALSKFAHETALAHLTKLAEDGKLIREGGSWRV